MDSKPTSPFRGLYLLVGVLIVIFLGSGYYLVRDYPTHSAAAHMAGAALLAAGLIGILISAISYPIISSLEAARRSANRNLEQIQSTLADRLQQLSVMLHEVTEQQLLSDRAKAVAYRIKDREALRRAIHEEIARDDWEAALVLCNDIERSFGYKQEADRFRKEIHARRRQIITGRVEEQLQHVDRHIKSEQWGAALQEAQRIMQMFPGEELVANLPADIETRRQLRKKQLLDSWLDAVSRKDLDGSIEILKNLDMYLTPAEAESMQDSARNVFKEKRELLRMEFTQAVQSHNWREAVALGDQIIRDFPNTRIAQEVRQNIEALRKLAEEPEMVKTG